jgi:hypothetical protein
LQEQLVLETDSPGLIITVEDFSIKLGKDRLTLFMASSSSSFSPPAFTFFPSSHKLNDCARMNDQIFLDHR